MVPEAATLLAILLAAPAGDPSGPWDRWHFVFGKEVEMSILFRRDAAFDETRLLVRSEAGSFELSSHQDPSGNDSTESVRWLATGETLERRILLKGWEAVAGCEDTHRPDACLLWRGANGSVASRMSQFSGEAARAARHQVAAIVSPAFKEHLFSLAEIFPLMAEFGSYTSDFLGLVWPDPFRRPAALRKGTRTRGCDFDALFGHPCSAVEREREEKRPGAGPQRVPGSAG